MAAERTAVIDKRDIFKCRYQIPPVRNRYHCFCVGCCSSSPTSSLSSISECLKILSNVTSATLPPSQSLQLNIKTRSTIKTHQTMESSFNLPTSATTTTTPSTMATEEPSETRRILLLSRSTSDGSDDDDDNNNNNNNNNNNSINNSSIHNNNNNSDHYYQHHKNYHQRYQPHQNPQQQNHHQYHHDHYHDQQYHHHNHHHHQNHHHHHHHSHNNHQEDQERVMISSKKPRVPQYLPPSPLPNSMYFNNVDGEIENNDFRNMNNKINADDSSFSSDRITTTSTKTSTIKIPKNPNRTIMKNCGWYCGECSKILVDNENITRNVDNNNNNNNSIRIEEDRTNGGDNNVNVLVLWTTNNYSDDGDLTDLNNEERICNTTVHIGGCGYDNTVVGVDDVNIFNNINCIDDEFCAATTERTHTISTNSSIVINSKQYNKYTIVKPLPSSPLASPSSSSSSSSSPQMITTIISTTPEQPSSSLLQSIWWRMTNITSINMKLLTTLSLLFSVMKTPENLTKNFTGRRSNEKQNFWKFFATVIFTILSLSSTVCLAADKQLTVESLKFLSENDLDRIFNPNQLGILIKFREHLKKWRNDNGFQPTVNSLDDPGSHISNWLEKFGEKYLNQSPSVASSKSSRESSPCSRSRSPISSHTKFNLESYLQTTGKALNKYCTNKEVLPTVLRDKLIKDIIQYYIENEYFMHSKDFEELAIVICETFTNERKEAYYYKGKYPSGRLFHLYKNSSTKLRKSGLFPRERTKTPKLNVLNQEEIVSEIDESDEQAYLKTHTEPWQQILVKWKNSCKNRHQQIKQIGDKNLDRLLSYWPRYKDACGSELIDLDFDFIFPNKGYQIIKKWDAFINKIIPIFQSEIKDKNKLADITTLNFANENQNDIDYIFDTCGGALITVRHVLTAGHCFSEKYATFKRITLGAHDDKFHDNEQYFEPSKLYIHSDYESPGKQNDIALIRLNRNVEINEANCTFPSRWEGTWFLSGNHEPVSIRGSTLSFRGKCVATDGDKFLIVDDKGCHRCLVIYEKHKNVLQYKESECDGDNMYMMDQSNPAALPVHQQMRSILNSDPRGGAHPNKNNGHLDQYSKRSNDDSNDCSYCKGRETLHNLCEQIAGDALLYSLFKENAEPVKCPLRGPYTFTYNRGHGECGNPVSNIESCTEDSRLLLSFQACPDVSGTESTVEELTCLATWKDGNSRYLVGLVSHNHAVSNEERYRCFVYEKIQPSLGISHKRGAKDEYKLAQSGDATCNGLDSAEVGSRIMTLQMAPAAERCDFPTWFKGPKHWHALMGNAGYIFHQSDGSLHITKPSGYMETRALCEQINKQTSTEMMSIVHYTTGCQSGFMCMMFYRRDTHVAEIQMGTPASRLEDACAADHFDVNKLQYITLLASNPESQVCPSDGLYTLKGAVGPPYITSRHKRNHSNKIYSHHHHSNNGGHKRHSTLSFRNTEDFVDHRSWHTQTRGMPTRNRRNAKRPEIEEKIIATPIVEQGNSKIIVAVANSTVGKFENIINKTAIINHPPVVVANNKNDNGLKSGGGGGGGSGVGGGVDGSESNSKTIDTNIISNNKNDTQRNRRDAPGCIVNYNAQRQLLIGCSQPNIIEVRPQCNDDGDEVYSCHGSWTENTTVFIIARHIGSQHGVCISYRPAENNAVQLIVGDACYRGNHPPPDHHLAANLTIYGKCSDTSSSSSLKNNWILINVFTLLTTVLITTTSIMNTRIIHR